MMFFKLIILNFLLIFGVSAKSPSYVIQELKGKAFFMLEGKPKQLKKGMRIGTPLEVFTEVGAEVSLSDYHDHLYHISGSSHALLHQRNLKLNEGYLWVQVLQESSSPFRVLTPNGTLDYTHGEVIISYDSNQGKTQVLSLSGTHHFKNLVQDFMVTDVKEGHFSFIDLDLNNGQPRNPTPIGYGSFQKVTSLFDKVEPVHQSILTQRPSSSRVVKNNKRATASVNVSAFESALQDIKQEDKEFKEIPVLKIPQSKAVVDSTELMKLYKKSVEGAHKTTRRKRHPSSKRNYQQYKHKSNVKVRVFGSSAYNFLKEDKSETKKREPSSLKRKEKKNYSDFERSLQRNYKTQTRHPEEVNSLIKELESVSMDYQEQY